MYGVPRAARGCAVRSLASVRTARPSLAGCCPGHAHAYWRPVVLAMLASRTLGMGSATLCEVRMHTLRRQGKRSNRFRRSGDMSFRCKWSVLRDGRVAGAFAAALAGPAGALEAGVVARAVGRGAVAAPSAGCTQERSKDECNALSACRVVRNAPGLPSDRSAAAAAQISGYTVHAGRQLGVILAPSGADPLRCRT